MTSHDLTTTQKFPDSGRQTTWTQVPTGELVLPPAVGVLAGRYRLAECVGRGGTAWVYKVVDEQTGATLAAKILRADVACREQVVERMAAEACAMMVLEHPHIARVVDMGRDEATDLHFVVLEWLGGGSLSDRIERDGPMDVERAVAVTLSVLDALDAAHQRGIIHRDVKPGNVMLDDQGQVKMVDFGIARVPDAGIETNYQTVMGSFSTMAPEQRLSAALVTPASDVYAVGALLYYLVTGRSPADLFALPADHPRWQLIPAALLPVVRHAMARRRSERLQTARAMADALTEFQAR